MPDGVQAPDGAVLLLSAEDGLRDTIRPRLDACGADVRRVHALTATRDLDGTERALELGRDLLQLEAAIERYTPGLVVIDPLSAYLGRADTWRDNEVRALLSPLASLADRHDCAVLGVLHLNKSASSRVLHRIMGPNCGGGGPRPRRRHAPAPPPGQEQPHATRRDARVSIGGRSRGVGERPRLGRA